MIAIPMAAGTPIPTTTTIEMNSGSPNGVSPGTSSSAIEVRTIKPMRDTTYTSQRICWRSSPSDLR